MSTALELAVGLAHDVRSPLGAIMSLAEVLESGASGPVTEKQRRLLSVVREAALSLSQITTDIVDAARVRTTKGHEAATSFDIQGVLSAVHAIVKPMAEHAGLNVVVTNRAPRRWVGAPTAITRVLLNLTTNALKYTERGTVEYGARQISPTRLQFFVRDSGRGMVSSNSVAAQQPQWRSAKSGLGLAISRGLVDAMGSSLTLESKPGEGCCFQFELNRKRRLSGVES